MSRASTTFETLCSSKGDQVFPRAAGYMHAISGALRRLSASKTRDPAAEGFDEILKDRGLSLPEFF